MKPLAIIALDPGATTAFCALDLNGQVLRIYSAKELPLSVVISKVIEVCQPIISVTDKGKTPSFVAEFSRKMGTKLILPEEDLTREEKRELVKLYFSEEEGKLFKNTHEFDCLSSSLYAYKKMFNRIKKINDFIVENKLEEKGSEFMILALKEEELGFQVIKEILLKPNEENKIIQEVIREDKITKKNFLQLFSKLNSSKKENEVLRERIRRLYQELNQLRKENLILSKKSGNVERRVDSLFKFKEERLKLQEKKIGRVEQNGEQLQQRIGFLHHFIEKVPHYQLVKRLNSLSLKEFEEKNKMLKIDERDFILLKDPNIYSEQVIEKLVNNDITLCSLEKMSKFLKSKFATVILSSTDIINSTEYFVLVRREVLQEKLTEKDMINEVVKEYKEARKRG
ncbi:MAG: DUF460 domain-containing protein [Candidatus Woesearchaeota archaeon]